MRSLLLLSFLFLLSMLIYSDELVIAGSGNVTSVRGYQVLEEAYSRIGFDTEFVILPAERALVMTSIGEYDGESVRIAGLENRYRDLVMIPVPIITLELVVISKDDDIEFTDWSSLAPYRIAYRIGSKIIENNVEGMNVFPVENFNNIIPMIESGRVDLGIVSREQAIKEIAKSKSESVRIIEPVLDRSYLYHYIHVKNNYLVDKLTAILEEMKENGEIEKILNSFKP